MTSYRISPDVTWVDSVDCGREDSTVWIARLDTAELFELRDTGWLIWVLIADGFDTVERILAEIETLETHVDFGEVGLEGFLSGLVEQGLLESVQH